MALLDLTAIVLQTNRVIIVKVFFDGDEKNPTPEHAMDKFREWMRPYKIYEKEKNMTDAKRIENKKTQIELKSDIDQITMTDDDSYWDIILHYLISCANMILKVIIVK